MENVFTFSLEILEAMDVTSAESIPPDKNDPNGTSDCIRIFTASLINS